MSDLLSSNSIVQNAIGAQVENDYFNEEEFEELDFNPLKVYFGDDYIVNNKICIHQPSIQDFIESKNENDLYNVIIPFISNTTAYRVQLWDMGIDWNNDITNLELFYILLKNIKHEYSQLMFGDIDFSTFKLCEKVDGDKHIPILYSHEHNLELDEDTIHKMSRYIQIMFNSFPPEEEFTSNKTLKQDLINNDRQKQLLRAKELKEKKGTQSLLSMIAFYLNHPGCPYKKNELREIGYFEFMYNIQRLQIFESTRALFNGMYCGLADLSKIDKNEFNFMRDIKITA